SDTTRELVAFLRFSTFLRWIPIGTASGLLKRCSADPATQMPRTTRGHAASLHRREIVDPRKRSPQFKEICSLVITGAIRIRFDGNPADEPVSSVLPALPCFDNLKQINNIVLSLTSIKPLLAGFIARFLHDRLTRIAQPFHLARSTVSGSTPTPQRF